MTVTAQPVSPLNHVPLSICEWAFDPEPIMTIVQKAFANLEQEMPKELVQFVIGYLRKSDLFGAEQWRRYFGFEVSPSFIPHNMDRILQRPCPFFGGLITEHFSLFYRPEKINNHLLTLSALSGALAEMKYPISISHNWIYAGLMNYDCPTFSHWILISNKLVATHFDRDALLNMQRRLRDISQQRDEDWQLLDVQCLTIGILGSHAENKRWLYGSFFAYAEFPDGVQRELSVGVGEDGVCLTLDRKDSRKVGFAVGRTFFV